MNVIKADVLGMCFGVRDALAMLERIEQPERVTVHGQLVHNEMVVQRLAARGFHQSDERGRVALPVTDAVLVTAHGISNRERQRLTDAGKILLDSTCPLVTRAHDAALNLQRDGFHVLVVGKRGHVEIQGIVEDLDSFDVVESPDEVANYEHAALGVMCQTTTPVELAERVLERVRQRNPHAEIRHVDTICHPTKDHQRALEQLLDRVDLMIVVGGRNSNNTKELVRRCQSRGKRTYHIQQASQLRAEWFEENNVVGLTAGTSTLSETIDEVEAALREERFCVGELV